ncbi:MAG: GNVR domain-containing protein, partial [Fervidobacterium sp.]
NSLQKDPKINYTPTSELIEKYRENLAELQTKYNSLLQQYTEQHPEVKAIKAQIKQLEVEIDREIKRIAESKIESPSPMLQELYTQLIQNQLKLPVLQTKLSATSKSINEIEQKMKKLPQIEQEYLNLERDYKIKQTVYSAMIQKYEELKLNTVSTEINKPQIIEPPYAPNNPSKPNKTLTLAIGSALGLIMGTVGAFLKEAADKKIRTVQDIQKLVQVPIMIHSKNNHSQSVKTMFAYIFTNYPEHRKILISSPDDELSTNKVSQIASEILRNASIKFNTIQLSSTETQFSFQILDSKLNEKLGKDDYVIIQSPEFKNNYDTLIAAKKADGVIITLRLNFSEKLELLNTLSLLEQNNIQVYGIIVM